MRTVITILGLIVIAIVGIMLFYGFRYNGMYAIEIVSNDIIVGNGVVNVKLTDYIIDGSYPYLKFQRSMTGTVTFSGSALEANRKYFPDYKSNKIEFKDFFGVSDYVSMMGPLGYYDNNVLIEYEFEGSDRKCTHSTNGGGGEIYGIVSLDKIDH